MVSNLCHLNKQLWCFDRCINSVFGGINLRVSFSVVPMIDYNRSTNKRALDDDVELAIINQNYVQSVSVLFCFENKFKYKSVSTNFTMSAIQSRVDI